MKGILLHLAILAVLASAALLVFGFDSDGRSASADDFIFQKCPTPTPGTPTATNTPGGSTKTFTPTSTPCIVKATPTPFAGSPTPCPTTGCVLDCPTALPPGPTNTPDLPACVFTVSVTPTHTPTFTLTVRPTITPCPPAGCPTRTPKPCPPEGCYRPCPTVAAGTSPPTNTPGGPTKTPTVTATPCFVTPTPPPAVGGVARGGGLAPGESDETARALWLAVLGAITVALSGSAWYARQRWIKR